MRAIVAPSLMRDLASSRGARRGRHRPMSELRVVGVEGIGELRAGDDLAALLATAFRRQGMPLADGDVLCVAQKAVSKVEGRELELADVAPSRAGAEIAGTRTTRASSSSSCASRGRSCAVAGRSS